MTVRFSLAAVSVACALIGPGAAFAQRGGGDWMTSGFDAQRSGWVRSDSHISEDFVKKGGMEFLWKLKLNGQPKQLNSVTQPALLDFYIGYRGFRTLGFFGTANDTVIGVDTDLARVEWERTIGSSAKPSAPSTLECPGGMTSNVTRRTGVGYPPTPGAGRGGPGRAGGAKSAVGAPGEGAALLKDQRPPQQFGPPPAQPAKPGRTRPAPGASPFGRGVSWLDALTSDGMLHSMYVSNGAEPNPAVKFLPPNANAQGLIIFDGVAYVETVNNCGGVENGLWSLNLESKAVSHWKSNNSAVDGSEGPAIGPDGTFYSTDGSDLVAIEAGSLKVKSSFKGSAKFTSSPVVFEFKGKDMVSVMDADGTLSLFDSAKLDAPVSKVAVAGAKGYAAGGLASWQDTSGTRWVLAPSASAVVAYKVVVNAGAIEFQTGWTSREMVAPLAPMIVNGVVFAVSSGEMRSAPVAERAKKSSGAVLYALQAGTGKELWNSGKAITSFAHSGGLAAGGNRVLVATYDGTQYAFGFKMEH